MTDANRIATYNSAIDGALRWIAENRQPDGTFRMEASSAAYFSVVTFANYTGRRDLAYSVLQLIADRFIDTDGTLKQPDGRKNNIAYVPSWIVWGAAGARWLSLSNQLVAFTQSMQHADTGGVFGSILERNRGQGAISFDGTTLAGIGFGRAGRNEACRRVGDYLLQLLAVQPAVNDRFYSDWQQPGGLITNEATTASVLQWDQPNQHYYKIGLFVVALLEAYGASGDREYLDGAVKGYRLATDRAVDLWNNTLSHKMCWAAAGLFAATGDAGYAEDACRYADHLITLQQNDGGFHYPELWSSYPPDAMELVPNLMCQLALWVAMARDALMAISKK